MARGQSYISSRCTALSLEITAKREKQRRWWREAWLLFFLFSQRKVPSVRLLGGVGAWKYLNLWSKKAFHQWPFCSLRSTRLYSVYCCHCFSSRGPRSVKPMPFITTTITISTTPMSLATRQPHSSGSNLCKQIIKKTGLTSLFTTASTSILQPLLPPPSCVVYKHKA